MAFTRALRRLLRIRDLEEEQCRAAMETALAERSRLQKALSAAAERERRSRRLIAASVQRADAADRLAGLEEARNARRLADALRPRLAHAERVVAGRRQEYLDKRVERRQVETLIREAEIQDTLAADRRAQQALDDWYGNQMHRSAQEGNAPAAGAQPSGNEPARTRDAT